MNFELFSNNIRVISRSIVHFRSPSMFLRFFEHETFQALIYDNESAYEYQFLVQTNNFNNLARPIKRSISSEPKEKDAQSGETLMKKDTMNPENDANWAFNKDDLVPFNPAMINVTSKRVK